VGGQLGGRFSSNAQGLFQRGAAPVVHATITCNRVRRSGDNTTYSNMWQHETPVYLVQTAKGVDASFIFDIPDHCQPTSEWSNHSAIEWNIRIEGEFGDAGKLVRNWEVNVQENSDQLQSTVNIPEIFLHKAKQQQEKRATAVALDQVPVTEDSHYISVHSKAGRNLVSWLLCMLFGAIFTAVGIFTVTQNWWPGYIFILVGSAFALGSLYALGKSIEVKIDKETRILYTRESWFGIKYKQNEAEVFDPLQFKPKMTSSSNTRDKVTEYYAINFESTDKNIRIADGLAGKPQALALINAITERLFGTEPDTPSLAA